MDEWSREFYFEGRRRMDLIRFNCFGGSNSYTWSWKGGTHAGTQIPVSKNIYALPANEINVSQGKLKQNTDY